MHVHAGPRAPPRNAAERCERRRAALVLCPCCACCARAVVSSSSLGAQHILGAHPLPELLLRAVAQRQRGRLQGGALQPSRERRGRGAGRHAVGGWWRLARLAAGSGSSRAHAPAQGRPAVVSIPSSHLLVRLLRNGSRLVISNVVVERSHLREGCRWRGERGQQHASTRRRIAAAAAAATGVRPAWKPGLKAKAAPHQHERLVQERGDAALVRHDARHAVVCTERASERVGTRSGR